MEDDLEARRFRSHNKWLAILATVFLVGLGGTIAVYLMFLRFMLAHPNVDNDMMLRLSVSWLPAIFYMWILWTLRGLFRDLASEGLGFRPPLLKALSRIGWGLMLAAVTTLAMGPLLNVITAPHRIGNFMLFDLPHITLVVVGLALILLARMLKRALKLEAETREMREVLETFI